MKPRKAIRKVSTKRLSEMRIYNKRKRVFLEREHDCFCCDCYTYPEDRDLHHLRGRSGALYLDERFWRMACGGMKGCHTKIHTDRKWAIANGFLAGPGLWGYSPKETESP